MFNDAAISAVHLKEMVSVNFGTGRTTTGQLRSADLKSVGFEAGFVVIETKKGSKHSIPLSNVKLIDYAAPVEEDLEEPKKPAAEMKPVEAKPAKK